MVEPISCVIPKISIHNNRPVTTSVAIANFFGKQHKNVLQKIRALECSPTFMTANFSAIAISTKAGFDEPRNRSLPNHQKRLRFPRDGVHWQKAAAFKEAYIAEFDRMEAELRQNHSSPTDKIIPGDGRTVVVHFDARGNIKFTETVPDGAMVCTTDTFQFYIEKHGWTLVNRNAIKNMTVEQLLNIK